jgi:hypothetical protein
MDGLWIQGRVAAKSLFAFGGRLPTAAPSGGPLLFWRHLGVGTLCANTPRGCPHRPPPRRRGSEGQGAASMNGRNRVTARVSGRER